MLMNGTPFLPEMFPILEEHRHRLRSVYKGLSFQSSPHIHPQYGSGWNSKVSLRPFDIGL